MFESIAQFDHFGATGKCLWVNSSLTLRNKQAVMKTFLQEFVGFAEVFGECRETENISECKINLFNIPGTITRGRNTHLRGLGVGSRSLGRDCGWVWGLVCRPQRLHCAKADRLSPGSMWSLKTQREKLH